MLEKKFLNVLNFQVKHQRAQKAWKNFADNMGRDNVR